MNVVAIVFADSAAVPSVTVAGGTVVERQIRQLRHAKVGRILVLGGDIRLGGSADVARVESPAALAGLLRPEEAVLVLAPGLVVDERVIAAVLAAPVPTIATWPARGTTPQLGIERIDPVRFAAGVAIYPAQTVIDTASGLGEWDFQSTLLRTALGMGDAELLDLAALDTYAPARRRQAPLIWAVPTDAVSAEAADNQLIAAAQKGVLDWPARFLHPWVEDLLVRLLLPLPITPNMVTAFVALLGIAAGIAFFYGYLWTGLVIALICGPLDGVDGKLARVRTEFSRWGDLEHVLDKICEYGWYLCLAAYLARHNGDGAPWAIAALLILFAFAEALLGEFYRRFTGRQLDDAGPFERRFRTIGGRRNTFFWTYLPFALFDAWYLGFAVMAIYAVVTFFVTLFRFFVQIEHYGRAIAPQVDANFARTAYAFLPERERSAS